MIGRIVSFMFQIFFSVILQSLNTYPSFRFLTILLYGQPVQIQQYCNFSSFFFVDYKIWSSPGD